MASHGLLVDYDWCTGCHSCEVACQQEHDSPPGKYGVTVTEYQYERNGRLKIDFMPFITDHCDLCVERRQRNELPACVKSCQAACMTFGSVQELADDLKKKKRAVLYSHLPAAWESD